jgi:hypothetical protein
MVPVEADRIEIRRLSSLPDELGQLGRDRGLFSSTQAIQPYANDQLALVITTASRNSDEAALLVSRTGQRSAWVTLPHDHMGSVLDRAETESRVAALLDLLGELPVDKPDRVGFGIKVDPTMMLTLGDESVVGSRNSATMSFAMRAIDSVVPDDAVNFTAVQANSAAIAEELIARLVAKLQA